MVLDVAAVSLVSPLGLTASEHVFSHRAEVSPHASGAFTTRDGDALPIHHCPWIAASRPWSSRVRLLAKQALARAVPASRATPILLIARLEALDGDDGLVRFLTFLGHRIAGRWSGSAAYVAAFEEAQTMLEHEPEVVVLAVDSRIRRDDIERWAEQRYSAFTRNPIPPSEGAAAMRLVARAKAPLAGTIHAYAGGRSDANDDNDLPADGAALTRVFTELRLPHAIPLVVGPRDLDPLRIRDFHCASVRHRETLERADMPSFEERIGHFGSAAGLMASVFALSWLRHELPMQEPALGRLALAWARSHDGTVGATLLGVGGLAEPRKASTALCRVIPVAPLVERAPLHTAEPSASDDWQGSVRRDPDRAAGITAPVWQLHVRTGLLERALALGADHHIGPHLERPEVARRLLAHVDALAESGLSAAELTEFAADVALDSPGSPWVLTLLFGCLDTSDADDALEAWLSSLDAAAFPTYDGVLEMAAAIATQPSPALRERARRWASRVNQPLLAAIALETTPAEALSPEVVLTLTRAEHPMIQAAVARYLGRTSPDATPHVSWIDIAAPPFAYEAARARILAYDLEPLSLLRERDQRAVAALGAYALDIIALRGDATDGGLACDLAKSFPSTRRAIDAMGRVGLPALFPRLLAELASDELADDAHAALQTALGPRAMRPSVSAWEDAMASLPATPEPLRLRGGARHSPQAVLDELRRPDLSAAAVRVRTDELVTRVGASPAGSAGRLAARSGAGYGALAQIAWDAFGATLEDALAQLAHLIR